MDTKAMAKPGQRRVRGKRDPKSVERVEHLHSAFWALPNDETLVTRDQAGAAAHLSRKSMELLAKNGDGPPYCVIGSRALYRKGDVIAWIDNRRKSTVRSTAERMLPPRRTAPGVGA